MIETAPTTAEPRGRRMLPLLGNRHESGNRHGGRSHMTCLFRCGNACDQPVPNETANPSIREVIEGVLSRRAMLKASAGAAIVTGAGAALTPAGAAAGSDDRYRPRPDRAASDGAPIEFQAVPPNRIDDLVVSTGDDYTYSVVARWGDPVLPGAPEFDPHAQTAQKQAMQFGYNCDYVGVVQNGRDKDSAWLVVNHEYTDEFLMFPGFAEAGGTTDEQKRIAMMAHGISVVKISRVGHTGQWEMSADKSGNRRFTTDSPFQLTGPVAGTNYVRTTADPAGMTALGTLNDCAGGQTPWGTTLHGEENFNQYFGQSAPIPADQTERLAAQARYGLPTGVRASERGWELLESRFDLAQEPNEANRQGWIVEVDPLDPTSTPKKRTALGRFKHEGANVRLAADGRVVAYMGDDERFDYIYKFVSAKKFKAGGSKAAREHNLTLLEEGDLYVAQFTGDSPAAEIDGTGKLPADGAFDGTGHWIPLVKDGRSMVAGKSVAWVLTYTRLAADLLGKDPADPTVVLDASKVPTRMDRPEDVEPNLVTGRVYAALTNNSNRNAAGLQDEANPLVQSHTARGLQAGNRNGHVLEWEEASNDAAALTFAWRIFLVAGDPAAPETYFAGFDKSQVSPISCPDNLAFDGNGNLWISTDGNVLGSNDGFFAVATEGPERGLLKQFLTVPFGAEACGPLITWDQESIFVAVQHPGETDGSTFETPSSTWPDKLASGGYPRPSVAVVWKTRGDKRIGSGGRASR